MPLAAGPRPLSGIRTLDLTRVIAGPVACRTMAEHGADVLKISRRDLPGAGPLDIDTGIGKRSCFLDLREAGDNATLRALVQQGDIFIQSYRPGAMAGNGFGFDDLAAMRPGIVCATLSAWGRVGPWSGRRGYDTIVQSATGMAHFTGGAAGPALLPVSAIDYISGNIMAFGAMVALHRRATIGGSWLVRVSLAGVGHWMRSLGLLDADVAFAVCPAIIGNSPWQGNPVYAHLQQSTLLSSEMYAHMATTYNYGFPVSPGAALFRRKDMLTSLRTQLEGHSDYDFAETGAGVDFLIYLLTARKYAKVAFHAEPLVFFRAHPGSITIDGMGGKVQQGYTKALAWFQRVQQGLIAA